MLAVTHNQQVPSITLKTELIGKITGRKIDAEALIDSGVEGIIINSRFAQENCLTLLPIKNPFPVCNVDGSENTMGWVHHYTIQKLRIYSQNKRSYHEEIAEFYVMDIRDHDVILGTDWLEEHNPEVDWSFYKVDMVRCPETCILEQFPVLNLHTKPKFPKSTIIDLRTNHKDYQVKWSEPIGRFKLIAQSKWQVDVVEFQFDPFTIPQNLQLFLLKKTLIGRMF
ncbi:hypothetical protein D9758_005657 [Tetrapyrgos nigripes]|uniref:Uncharacterized protein n=1 Tax=Tetrapyrgos nigripes TaxID=182062 RepID=A0A8H5GK37_9AGAR|nr:hypothetical protein D9758_005657 [Tetrapyrgos nigripes]